MLKHISYSYLHLLACPYAAFLRYRAAIRNPINEYLALGNALHLGLEKGYTDEGFNGHQAHQIFEKEFNNLIDDEEVFIGYPKRKKMEADGASMLARFTKQVESGLITSRPYAVEAEFKIPFEGTNIVGRIDRVDYIPELGFTIVDYKSGSKEPDPWFLRHNLQLTAYAWACRELYGELPRQLVWHHLRNGKMLGTERTEEDIDNLKRMISNAIFMDKNEIHHRIYHEQICNWCDFKGEVCDDTELEKEIMNAGR